MAVSKTQSVVSRGLRWDESGRKLTGTQIDKRASCIVANATKTINQVTTWVVTGVSFLRQPHLIGGQKVDRTPAAQDRGREVSSPDEGAPGAAGFAWSQTRSVAMGSEPADGRRA